MPPGLDDETKRQAAMAAQMQAMMKAQQASGGVLPGMEHVMAQLGVGVPGAGGAAPGGGGSVGSAARPRAAAAPQASQGRAAAPPREEHMNWPEPEPGAIWEVVGGEETGGIIVRAGRELTSPQEKRRLSTSALIREEELVADRLRYTRVTGSGPLMGWVSLTIRGSGKPLIMKVEGAEGPGQEEAYHDEGYYAEQYSQQYGHYDAPVETSHWQSQQNQWEAAAAAPMQPEPQFPPQGQWAAPAPEPVAPPEPAPQAAAAPEPAPPAPPAPALEPEPEDELAWLRRLLEKAEMLPQFDKAAEWVAETGCEESDMRSGEGVEELIEHLELKKFPANRLRKAVKALQDEPPPEKKAAQPAAAVPPPPAPAAAPAPPAPVAPAPPAAAASPPAQPPAPPPAASSPAPAARAPARAPRGSGGFQPPPRAGGPEASSSSRAAPAEVLDLPSADALLAQLDGEQRSQNSVPMPSVEDVLARLERDAAEEAPEVPGIAEVLAALERDAQEEADLQEAAEARSEFFKLSEETTVSLPGAKQWWQDPVLRLDGPKFNFAAAGLLGKHEYMKTQPDYSPDAERPPEDPKPPTGWFKSRPGLEERLASAEVVRGAKRAARVAKSSKASGGTKPAADEAARAKPTEATEAPE